MDHIALHLTLADPVRIDLLIGQLTQLGYSGFEQPDDGLIAVIPAEAFRRVDTETLLAGIPYTVRTIPEQNWNALWEQSFSPVRIGDFCAIRAAFHPPVTGVSHELIITPRMTFGTGHHATTVSMIRLMQPLPLQGKSVLDIGTGTGILAILAHRMGAHPVHGVDIDPLAVENARENASENDADPVSFSQGDTVEASGAPYDCILANIHLKVIIGLLDPLSSRLRKGGWLLLSGILSHDMPVLTAALDCYPLVSREVLHSGDWTSLCLQKQTASALPQNPDNPA
jgi:ribosomal protein L11 methyltransferase